MSSAVRLPALNSYAALAPASELRREPRSSRRPRPSSFYADYEDRALFYDCFWSGDGRVLLVGPPLMNLASAFKQATFSTRPERATISPNYHKSISVTVVELNNVLPTSTEVVVTLDGSQFVLPIQPSSVTSLAGRRVLFTMSKDNDLAWIAEWAAWHVRRHGTNAIVLFDNNSTRYSPAEVAETLMAVPGLQAVAVQSWPYIYGATDRAVMTNPYYTQFLQVASMGVALRRYAAKAAGLLNCDIDELVETGNRGSVYDIARDSPHGLVVMRGQFVEAVPASTAPEVGLTHRHFPYRLRDETRRVSRPRKWALDPTRRWVQYLDVHPYMHWIRRRPWFGKTSLDDVFYWHFRGINTGWKDRRSDASRVNLGMVEVDTRLAQAWKQDHFDE